MNDQALKDLAILVVDDQESNLALLVRVLERAGYNRITAISDPALCPQLVADTPPDLIILDLHMPGMNGFELMDRLASVTGSGTRVPLLVLTADVAPQAKLRALSMGARDFLTKPIDPTEVTLRVRNLLQVGHLQTQLRRHNEELEEMVLERTHDLEQARLEILDRLAAVAEYRDDDTQEHARRIGRTSALLGRELGLDPSETGLLRRAAPLHDIGKVGIPDHILLKPGRLTEAEFEFMKLHTTMGAEVLARSRSPVLRLAEVIALNHHERWDGGGYPNGVHGEDIPLAGRIVAVADVFDALTHRRPYMDAWPVAEAVCEILVHAGDQFDTRVVEAFKRLDHEALLASVDRWDSAGLLPGTPEDAGVAVVA
jgi:putative two-component system response regulator